MRFSRATTPCLWSRVLIGTAAILFSSAVLADTDLALGDSRAPVTIVEYGSLTCDYCVHFHRKVLPLIKARHIDTGRVRFVYSDFPTGTAATRGAIAARCADDQYYTMLNTLFTTVGQWSRARNVDTALIQQAVSLGYEADAFRVCLADPQQMRAVEKAQQQATAVYQVIGTPTFLINGRIVRGIQDIDEMELLIEEALLSTGQQDTDASAGKMRLEQSNENR